MTDTQIAALTEQGLGPEERYVIHTRTTTGLHRLATAPTPQAIGLALCTLASEGEFVGCQVGVRDAAERVWVVSPFTGGA